MTAPVPREIHLVNDFVDAAGGSEWEALTLFKDLRDHADVQLWTEREPDPRIAQAYPINRIVPRRLRFPRSGTLVFVGAFSLPLWWIHMAHPRRIILLHITNAPLDVMTRLRLIFRRFRHRVEVVYGSELVRRSSPYPGVVQHSPIDLSRFTSRRKNHPTEPSNCFTIGRLSRDIPEKHDPGDIALYRRLTRSGCRIRIMGGTCLSRELQNERAVELLPACAEEPQTFLQGLNCFYYRTSEQCLESFGRVVVEAMACELPVVCHNRGGYVEIIDHGRNGFLFDTREEAFALLRRLSEDESLRRTIGRAARETVEEMYSPARRAAILSFYLR